MQLIYVTDRKRHLICLPYSVDNLHQMARELDIKRLWFHKTHYDIPKRRIREIENKCVHITSKDLVNITRGYTNEVPWAALQEYNIRKSLERKIEDVIWKGKRSIGYPLTPDECWSPEEFDGIKNQMINFKTDKPILWY